MGAKIPTPWLFTLFFVLAMFLPRIVQDGMFMDGTIYAAIARHLAGGNGDFWSPYYHSIGDNSTVFYMHPALKMWLQSHFFRAFNADAWWVERLYCFLELLLHLWLIRKIWQHVFKTQAEYLKRDWLPVLFWFLMPLVSWAMPNNMLENTLNLFALGAVWTAFKAREQRPLLWLPLCGLLVWLAFLTKGPVGLYPLAAPFLIWAYSSYRVWIKNWQVLFNAKLYVPLFTLLAMFAAHWQYAPARHFFEQYWKLQIRGALDGSSVTTHPGIWGHLYLCGVIWAEVALPLLATILLFWLARRKNATQNVIFPRSAQLFLLIGATAFFPMLLSIKQRGFYMLPALPWFAMALAAMAVPYLERLQWPEWKWPRLLAGTGIALVLAFSLWQAGTIGRDKAYLTLIKTLNLNFPEGGKICICKSEVFNYPLEAYLQRYADFTLTINCHEAEAAIFRHSDCDSVSRQGINVERAGDWTLELFK